jgi:hypothetical protein
MPEHLTENFVRKAPAPGANQILHWDRDVKGFALRITRAGAKSFVLDYRCDGRQRRMSLLRKARLMAGAEPSWNWT